MVLKKHDERWKLELSISAQENWYLSDGDFYHSKVWDARGYVLGKCKYELYKKKFFTNFKSNISF